MTWPELTAILLAVAAFGGMLIQWRNGRTVRQTGDASAARDISEAYQTLIEPLEGRVKELEMKLEKAEATVAKLNEDLEQMTSREKNHLAGIRILITQITSLGEKPLWKPEDFIG